MSPSGWVQLQRWRILVEQRRSSSSKSILKIENGGSSNKTWFAASTWNLWFESDESGWLGFCFACRRRSVPFNLEFSKTNFYKKCIWSFVCILSPVFHSFFFFLNQTEYQIRGWIGIMVICFHKVCGFPVKVSRVND